VIAVNAWMNTPQGFRLEAGQIVDVDLWKAFFTPAFPTQALHMALAAYSSVAFAVLGIHAWRLLVNPNSAFHRAALRIVLPVAIVSAPLQALSGDFAAKHVAAVQPLKLAAAEALFHTQAGAPLLIGGVPDLETSSVRAGIHLPKLLSVLATGDPNGTVRGLHDFPREEWPPVMIVHFAFQLMVACGLALIALAAWAGWFAIRRRDAADSRAFLRAATLVAPLGLVAVEAGWVVTEVGRQPWIIRGVMRVADAVTPMPGLIVSLGITVALYLVLGVVVVVLLRRHVLNAPEEERA